MKSKPLPSKEEIEKYVSYCPETGVFTALRDDVAIHEPNCDGYIHIRFDGELHRAHRIAWKVSHGVDPDIIHHMNSKRDDNRLRNIMSVNRNSHRTYHRGDRQRVGGINGHLTDGIQYEDDGTWSIHIGEGDNKILLICSCRVCAYFIYKKLKELT